jgi:Ca2+-binding RTX toxin-like protein
MDRAHRPSSIESLEPRRLMAVTVDLHDNVLTITADPSGTRVDATCQIKEKLFVSIDGGPDTQYSTKRVKKFIFQGDDGNDSFFAHSTFDDPTTSKDEARSFFIRTRLFGGAGDDDLESGYGNDKMDGGAGNDTISAGGGDDIVVGGSGDDTIDAGPLPDDLYPDRDGNDYVFAASGNDTVQGGREKDVLFGSDGDDYLLGGSRRDLLFGNAGIDNLDGQQDDDIEYTGGQVGDVISDTQGRNTEKFEELDDFETYFSRILRAVVPENMRASAKS